MDSRLLIDAVVQQTTVLIAQLSTAMGIRAPLAHVADQVFLDLAREIEAQGVSRKVVADMFGMALRTYQRKMQRLAGSASESHRTLWQAIYEFIGTADQVTRKQIDERFRHDPSEHVGAVLNDLVLSGLVYSSGRGLHTVFKHVAIGGSAGAPGDHDALDELLCLGIYRGRGMTLEELGSEVPADARTIERSVRRLLHEGRISEELDDDGAARFRALRYVIPVGQTRGWEAAVFDHFSTVAAAIAHKLRLGPGSRAKDIVGGATLSFDIEPGHPLEHQVYGLLRKVRGELNELWNQVDAWNAEHPVSDENAIKVSFYFGQNVSEIEGEPTAADEVQK